MTTTTHAVRTRSIAIKWILLLCVVGLAAVSLGNVILKAYADAGFQGARWGHDFTQWWHGGQALFSGDNPYRAMLPSAAPVVLLLAPLALLPWVPATLLWLLINGMLGVLCVWLMLRLNGRRLASWFGVIMLFLFAALIATRQVVELGQISLLIAVCTLGAIALSDQRPVSAGVLLGIAISKYTMSFPVLLYAVWRRQYRLLIACIATQLLGLVVVAAAARTSPLEIVRDYARYSQQVLAQTQDYSVHLLSLGWGAFGYAALALCSVALGWLVFVWWRRATGAVQHDELTRLTLIGVVTMWSMWSMYHGRQDMVLAFLFVITVLIRTAPLQSRYVLTSRETLALNLFVGVVVAVWVLPLYAVTGMALYRSLYAITDVAVSFVWGWLLFRISPSPLLTE